MKNEINYINNGIEYDLIKTSMYKTIVGILYYAKPLEEKDYTYYALLNRLIASTTKNYPSKKELAMKLYGLYDSTIYMTTDYSYKTAFTSFVFQIVNCELINDNTIFDETIKLLDEIMYNPNIENNCFKSKDFEEEKRSLENDIKNIYNNKRQYAYCRLLETMFPNDILSASTQGSLEILNNITKESLYQFYLDLLNNSKVYIGISGNINKEDIDKHFSSFHIRSTSHEFLFQPPLHVFKSKVQEIKEYQKINQAKLMLGYKFNLEIYSKMYFNMLVFNTMFGGIFSSSLFNVIREKNSLAYDIQSEVLFHKNILVVSVGIDASKYDIVVDLVKNELKKYNDGIINEKLLNDSKEFLINDIKETQDSQYAVLNFKLNSHIKKRHSLDETINEINKVSINDIKEVSNLLHLDTIYCLLPGEKDE